MDNMIQMLEGLRESAYSGNNGQSFNSLAAALDTSRTSVAPAVVPPGMGPGMFDSINTPIDSAIVGTNVKMLIDAHHFVRGLGVPGGLVTVGIVAFLMRKSHSKLAIALVAAPFVAPKLLPDVHY